MDIQSRINPSATSASHGREQYLPKSLDDLSKHCQQSPLWPLRLNLKTRCAKLTGSFVGPKVPATSQKPSKWVSKCLPQLGPPTPARSDRREIRRRPVSATKSRKEQAIRASQCLVANFNVAAHTPTAALTMQSLVKAWAFLVHVRTVTHAYS